MSETKNKAGEQSAAPTCKNCGKTRLQHWIGRPFCEDKSSADGFSVTKEWAESSRAEQFPPVPSASSKRCNYKPHNVECNKVVEFKLIDSDTGHEFFVCGEHEPDYAARNKRAGREVFVIIKLPAERVVPPEPTIEALQAKVSRLEQALRTAEEWCREEASLAFTEDHADGLARAANHLRDKLAALSGEQP